MNYYVNGQWTNNGWTTSPPITCQQGGDHKKRLDPETGDLYCGVCLEWMNANGTLVAESAAATGLINLPHVVGTASTVAAYG